jgi:hypothetical protein
MSCVATARFPQAVLALWAAGIGGRAPGASLRLAESSVPRAYSFGTVRGAMRCLSGRVRHPSGVSLPHLKAHASRRASLRSAEKQRIYNGARRSWSRYTREMATAAKILEEALALTPDQRVHLVQELLESLDGIPGVPREGSVDAIRGALIEGEASGIAEDSSLEGVLREFRASRTPNNG